jgi:hypothetical protein
MNINLIEQLLNEDEGTGLDFKRDQYPFDGATDEQKSELLKDILAFTNAWRRMDGYILIGIEEIKGGRSKVVGISEHLDDAKLQQFVNSKTQRPISFSYEAIPLEGIQVGIIRISLQARPIYLKQDYGKLKKHTVYVRRGSSTAIADPDEISRMGSALEEYQPRPKLSLVARVTYWDTIIIAIKNEGKGIAKTPYLLFTIPDNYRLSPYGVDGIGTEGFLGKPLGGSDLKLLRYGARSNIIIHPDTMHDVAALKYTKSSDNRPTGDLLIECELATENTDTIKEIVTIDFQELTGAFDSYQEHKLTDHHDNMLGAYGANKTELPNIIRASKELKIVNCNYLTGKANRMIGELVGVKNAQVVDISELTVGYTHFLLKDSGYFDCVIKHGDLIEDIIIECPKGNFYGVIKDDLFNYPFLYVSEYEPNEG